PAAACVPQAARPPAAPAFPRRQTDPMALTSTPEDASCTAPARHKKTGGCSPSRCRLRYPAVPPYPAVGEPALWQVGVLLGACGLPRSPGLARHVQSQTPHV